MKCCYGELSSYCVGGLRPKGCHFFQQDEKLKYVLSEMSKIVKVVIQTQLKIPFSFLLHGRDSLFLKGVSKVSVLDD